MQVLSCGLDNDLSLTLVNDGDGWRFFSWSRRLEEVIEAPRDEDRRRVFANAQEATRHFNLRYGRSRPIRSLTALP
ncbi:MAG: hypothetical protein SF182_13530 [Deltaproteobacteria bacterium]|nr:hypothetical protein [Deltaproteobacteria bacterium]